MRINDPNRGPKGDVNVAAGQAKPKPAAAADGQARAQEAHEAKETRESVKLNVSAKARALAEQSSVDEAKVARLREQIEKGEFKIDARAIAQKLVGED